MMEFIAHRGDSERYPENTLIGLHAAIQCGARYVEFDVQLTADGVPMVIHDHTLQRTGGGSEDLFNCNLSDLTSRYVGEPNRFDDRFAQEALPTLAQVVGLFQQYPHVTAFVELKRASIRSFGADFFLDRVLPLITPLKKRVVVISYDHQALDLLRRQSDHSIGWVFEDWSDESKRIANDMKPEFLLSDYQMISDDVEPLWEGDWQWALYDITDYAVALELAKIGVGYIETWSICDMLAAQQRGESGR